MTVNLENAQPLSDEVISGLANLKKPEGYVAHSAYSPNESLLAIRRAGMYLRHNPDQTLTDAPVYLNKEQRSDISSRVLASMINASIYKASRLDNRPDFICTDPAGLGICYRSEPSFLSALRELHNGYNSADIITDGKKPVLLAKHVGERACLTLCDVTIDGVPYPPGSIATYEIDLAARLEAERTQAEQIYKRFDVSNVKSLGFLRLSRFALPVWEQQAWDDYKNTYSDTSDGPLNTRYLPIRKIVSQVGRILRSDEIHGGTE